MPRKTREKSSTGIYHIMVRGINQQNIFEDDEDYEKMKQIIKEVKTISNFQIYAYILMGNHYHILIKVGGEETEQIFRRIGSRYVYWFNAKYKRSGHLFQDRYRSEPIESDEYLLSVLRYIHQNPVKSGICKKAIEYKWGSYKEYIKKQELIDPGFIFELLDKNRFKEYHKTETPEKIMDIGNPVYRLSEKEAKGIIEKISNCNDAAEFQKLSITEQKQHIKKFKQSGISIRQINKLTGISRGIVERVKT